MKDQNFTASELIPVTSKKRVIIAGGGFGGINLAKKLRGKGFQVVLLDKNNYHTFQPLLYQVATGGLEPDSIAYPLRKIFQRYKDFYFRLAMIININAAEKKIFTNVGELSYDFLVLATGSTNNFFGMTELAKKAMPLKTLTDALDLRSLLLQNMEMSLIPGTDRQKYLNIVIAGGGPTGVETAGALSELRNHVLPNDYPELNFKEARIILAESGSALLGGMSANSSKQAFDTLSKMGVEIFINTAVKAFDGEKVLLANDMEIPTVSLIWSAGVKGETVNGIDPAILTRNNRIPVDRFNRITGMEHVFAIGDVAFMKEDSYPNGHPMVAQVAIQQADNLAKNIVALTKSATLRPFHYRNLGALATIGRNKAVADFPYNIRFRGFFAWFLWMTVHLMTIVGFRNRIVVFINWVWNYFSYDRAIRLIIRPFKRSDQ
jgi:NADH:ubiquinone reductase (H+-translocating)